MAEAGGRLAETKEAERAAAGGAAAEAGTPEEGGGRGGSTMPENRHVGTALGTGGVMAAGAAEVAAAFQRERAVIRVAVAFGPEFADEWEQFPAEYQSEWLSSAKRKLLIRRERAEREANWAAYWRAATEAGTHKEWESGIGGSTMSDRHVGAEAATTDPAASRLDQAAFQAASFVATTPAASGDSPSGGPEEGSL